MSENAKYHHYYLLISFLIITFAQNKMLVADIAIYTLTSGLHDEQAVEAATKEFLNGLNVEFVFRGNDFADYGSHALELIYVRTGGTEGLFKELLPELQRKKSGPLYLLTSGKSNSLAASMEIMSFLRQQGLEGEIIHGDAVYICRRIMLLRQVETARQQLQGCRLGIIGEPSDWLISSRTDADIVRQKTGIELVKIPMDELLMTISVTPQREVSEKAPTEAIRQALPGAQQIHEALRIIVTRHKLQGLTLRCFDLLTSVRNTGCLALAQLNAEGIAAGCEGDVPALLSMMIAKTLVGVGGFQANPASIDPETGEMVFAHCTIGLNMVERYELDTHFESGIGVGIRGYMKPGPVTIFKVSGDMTRHFIAEGELLRCEAKADLCRTQMVIRLNDKRQTGYFLTEPIGNHHIILPGNLKEILMKVL